MNVVWGWLRGGAGRLAGQGSRGAAEIGVVAVIGALIAGGSVGIGLTDIVSATTSPTRPARP